MLYSTITSIYLMKKLFHLKLLFLITVFIGLNGLLASEIDQNPTFVINDGFQSRSLGKFLYYSNVDRDSGQYTLSKQTTPNLGFSKKGYNIYLDIINLSKQRDFRLMISQPLVDFVSYKLVNASGLILDSGSFGERFPFKHRSKNDPYFIIDLKIPQDEAVKLQFFIQTAEQLVLPAYISNANHALSTIKKRDILFGGYFGIILVMALYNLFVFYSTRDKAYLLYVFYILLVGATQGCLEGYTFQYIWPDALWFTARSVHVFSGLVSIASIFFMREFLQTKTNNVTIHKLSDAILVLVAIALGLALYQVNQISHMFMQAAIGLVALFLFSGSLRIYLQGVPQARYFFAAWLILVVGIFAFVLKDAGIIPANIYTNYTLQVGSAIEVVLLSLALGDRINILQKETNDSRETALAVAKENQRIVARQNIMLEEKVKERTKELNDTNETLAKTLTNLKHAQSRLIENEKLASVGQLTAGIAHEINNPINFVKANVEPLKRDVEDIYVLLDKLEKADQVSPEVLVNELLQVKKELDIDYVRTEINQLLAGISDGANRTAEIVKGLRTFSRLDELDFKPIDLNEGIRSTIVLIINEIPNNLRFELNLNLITNVDCRGGKINQVFMNLITNALYALKRKDSPLTDKDGLTIETKQEGNYAIITVSDTGEGMSEETVAKIFEPFYTTKPVGEGVGLGLSIVHGIIKEHNGFIEVKSKLGIGTAFIVKLPIVKSR